MIIMFLLGLVLLYLLVGAALIKLIQLYDSSKGIEKKEEFYLCILLWPVILAMFVGDHEKDFRIRMWKGFTNCSCLDWFFNLGKKK